MPKVTCIKPNERQIVSSNIAINIRARGAQLGAYDFVGLERLTGVDASTFCRNQKHPEHWTLKTLFAVASGLKVPIEWLFVDHSEINADK